MSNFVGRVLDSSTGQPIRSANVVANVATDCPVWAPHSGWGINEYTDASGRWSSDDSAGDCSGSIEGTIKATGYLSYPINMTFGTASGDIGCPTASGDVYLTPATVSNSLGGGPSGQGVGADISAGLGSNISLLEGMIQTGALYVVIAIVAFAIVVVVIAAVIR